MVVQSHDRLYTVPVLRLWGNAKTAVGLHSGNIGVHESDFICREQGILIQVFCIERVFRGQAMQEVGMPVSFQLSDTP